MSPRRRVRHLAAAAAAALLLAASGAGARQEATAPAYEEIDVAQGGAVSGVVRLPAVPRKGAAITVTKDAGVCGDHKPNETIVRAADGGLRNAVVSLEGIAKGKPIDRAKAVRLNNHACRFEPHVAAVSVGQRMEITNSDPVLHNTHAKLTGETEKTVFNIALPIQNQKVPKTIREPGLMRVKCDAGHTWMSAYVYAFNHPYFAVTDEKGAFRIDRVPPGTYTVRAWHEELGTQTVQVTVVEGADATASFDRLSK